MSELLTIGGLMTLGMLILLQIVLGFDNLLYISLESKRAEASQQRAVRLWGIGIAIVLRIVLLGVLYLVIGYFRDPFVSFDNEWFGAQISVHSLIVLFGGGFILYTAIKEIFHMISIHEMHNVADKRSTRSFASATFWIVLMNLVFSFDSILSAMALTKNFLIMTIAIVISGVVMILLAETVSEFLKKNRMYEVLGLFVLFIVGLMLVSEGGHLAHVHLWRYDVEPMAKSTFYFTLIVLLIVDIVQGRYQRKLLAEQKAHQPSAKVTTSDV